MRTKIRIFVLVLVFALSFDLMSQVQEVSQKTSLEQLRERREILRIALEKYKIQAFSEVLEITDSILAVDSSDLDAIEYHARALVGLADTAQAINMLEKKLAYITRAIELRLYLSGLYINVGRTSEVMRLTDEILAVSPHNSKALYIRARGFLDLGDTLQALELMDQAISEAFK